MPTVTLQFKCGHQTTIDPDKTTSPVCACGERVIARTSGVGAPRISGHARGPLAQQRDLPAIPVNDLMQTKDASHG